MPLSLLVFAAWVLTLHSSAYDVTLDDKNSEGLGPVVEGTQTAHWERIPPYVPTTVLHRCLILSPCCVCYAHHEDGEIVKLTSYSAVEVSCTRSLLRRRLKETSLWAAASSRTAIPPRASWQRISQPLLGASVSVL